MQEKALSRATNEVPSSGDDSNVPLEHAKSLGMVVHVLANKQSSSHETTFMDGDYAANQEALERNASLLPTSKLVSCSDATPHRGTCAVRIKKAIMLIIRHRIAP